MKRLSILIAAVLIFSMFAIVANAAELINVAEGKSYTVDIGENGTPGYGYEEDSTGGYGDGPNAERQRLTDGVVAGDDGGALHDGQAIVGAQNTTEATFVVDLGSSVSGINELIIDMYKCEDWDIHDPISVEYLISDDDSTYTSLGTVAVEDAAKKGTGSWEGWNFNLKLSEAKTARYVKVIAKAENYVWSSEIQVLADTDADTDTDKDTDTDTDKDTDTSESPQTGDAALYSAIGLIIVSVAVGVVVIYKKNRT